MSRSHDEDMHCLHTASAWLQQRSLCRYITFEALYFLLLPPLPLPLPLPLLLHTTTLPLSDASVSARRVRIRYFTPATLLLLGRHVQLQVTSLAPAHPHPPSHIRPQSNESGGASSRSESLDLQGPKGRHILFQQWAANRGAVEEFTSARGLSILALGA